MTKPLMQGRIGYWVNGVLVHMPQRNMIEQPRKQANHTKRNKEWKQYLKQKKVIRDTIKMRYSEEVTNELESLKNASKQGNIERAISALRSITNVGNKYNKSLNLMRYIFFADVEERSALYYAAHAGHLHLVELYLALYIIYTAQISSMSIKKKCSYREWFLSIGVYRMGLMKKFSIVEYDTCVLNSLNMKIKQVMTKKKVTINDALVIIKDTLEFVPKRITRRGLMPYWDELYFKIDHVSKEMDKCRKQQKKIKMKKPCLNYGSYHEDLLCDEIDLHDSENDSENYVSTDDEDCNDSNDNSTANKEVDFSMIGYSDTRSTNKEDFSIQDYSIIEYNDFQSESENDILLEWDIQEFNICEDESKTTTKDIITYPFNEGQTIALKYTEVTLSSHDNAPTSYKEALLAKTISLPASISLVGNHKHEQVIKDDNSSHNIDEECHDMNNSQHDCEYDNDFDAELLRDHYKFSRGGKVGKLFRGNSRTQKSWNSGRINSGRIKVKKRRRNKKNNIM